MSTTLVCLIIMWVLYLFGFFIGQYAVETEDDVMSKVLFGIAYFSYIAGLLIGFIGFFI